MKYNLSAATAKTGRARWDMQGAAEKGKEEEQFTRLQNGLLRSFSIFGQGETRGPGEEQGIAHRPLMFVEMNWCAFCFVPIGGAYSHPVHEHLLVHLQGATNCELDEAQLANWPRSGETAGPPSLPLSWPSALYVPWFALLVRMPLRESVSVTPLTPPFRHRT